MMIRITTRRTSPARSRRLDLGPRTRPRPSGHVRFALVGASTTISIGLALFAAGPLAAAVTTSASTGVVISEHSADGHVGAVVSVPGTLSRLSGSSVRWNVQQQGHNAKASETRLTEGHLELALVVDQDVSQATLDHELGAAAELLHDAPSGLSATLVAGRSRSGTTVSTVVRQLASLRTTRTSLGAAVEAVPSGALASGTRRAIVLIAPCSADAEVADQIPVSPQQELDVLGVGSGCPTTLSTAVKDRQGIVASAASSPDALSSAGDVIADRLLGEYAVTIATTNPAPVTLVATSSAGTATFVVRQADAQRTRIRAAATARNSRSGNSGRVWRAVAAALAALVLMGHVLRTRRGSRGQPVGRAVTTMFSR